MCDDFIDLEDICVCGREGNHVLSPRCGPSGNRQNGHAEEAIEAIEAIEEFPRTLSGKVKKVELRNRLRNQAK